MNKLIEEAENLYKQIDRAQVHLINARLNNDEKGKKSAISEMETAMCNAMQLLKCFIERKNNIVDLGELGIDYAYGKLREKMNRIKVLRNKHNMVENEGLEDALLDTAGYAILTLVELKKRKGNDKSE